MTKIATRREDMTAGAREVLDQFDDFLTDILEVKNDAIPAHLRGKRDEISLISLLAKITPAEVEPVDPYGVSVKFNSDRAIMDSTPERLETLCDYCDAADKGDEITPNHIDDRQLYENQVNFACQLAKWGWFTEDDFSNEDEI